MVKALRRGQMVQSMTDNTYTAKSTDKVVSHGQTEAPTSDNLKKTTFRDMVLTTGQTVECS